MVLAKIGHVRFHMVNSTHRYRRCLLIKIYRPHRIVFTLKKFYSVEAPRAKQCFYLCLRKKFFGLAEMTFGLADVNYFNRHTDSSVIYSNKVRQVYSETVIITRAPEIQISFSCHYSRHGLVSTGAIRGKDTEDNFEPEDNHCWKNR